MAAAIVFYVSGHGFGHASRSIEVINAILAKRPETRIGVRTSAPRWLFDLTVKGKVAFSTLECDTGVVQVDALTLDEADSIRRASAFHSDLVTRAASETRVAARARRRPDRRRHPAAGLRGGRLLRHPVDRRSATSPGTGSTPTIRACGWRRRCCRPSAAPTPRRRWRCGCRWRRGFDSFSNVKDIPFIARHATRTRAEVCKILKLPTDKPIVLASFGGYGLPGLDTDVLVEVQEVHGGDDRQRAARPRARKEVPAAERKGSFISINEEAMYDAGVRYEDLVGAAEAVVTKPGYGIISECIANDTAVLYTSRGHFPEYDVLVEEMPKYVRSAFITHDDLFDGKWETHLDKLLASRSRRRSRRPTAPTSPPTSC